MRLTQHERAVITRYEQDFTRVDRARARLLWSLPARRVWPLLAVVILVQVVVMALWLPRTTTPAPVRSDRPPARSTLARSPRTSHTPTRWTSPSALGPARDLSTGGGLP